MQIPPATTESRHYRPPDCDRVAEEVAAPLIEGTAKAQGLHPGLLRAVIERESAYRPCAVSPVGAQGLMQLMPATAGKFGVDNPFDPRQNIDAGAKYLKQLIERYKGDLALALAAYNAGPTTVDRAAGSPAIRETQDYVRAILDKIGPVQQWGESSRVRHAAWFRSIRIRALPAE